MSASHDSAHGAAHDEHGGHHHHITPIPVYLGVFGALLVLTVITVWIAQFHFGSLTTVIAMLVATAKASLVALIFMHLLYDERLNLVAFGFGLIFVALFFIFTLADVMTRGYIDPIRAPGAMEAEKIAALRVEYEAKLGAPAPGGKGVPVPPIEERLIPPAPPAVAPGPGALEGAGPEGAEPGVEGAVPGVEGALPDGAAAPDGIDAPPPGPAGDVVPEAPAPMGEGTPAEGTEPAPQGAAPGEIAPAAPAAAAPGEPGPVEGDPAVEPVEPAVPPAVQDEIPAPPPAAQPGGGAPAAPAVPEQNQ